MPGRKTMAERQETSVMASIQDLLREHQRMEEQERTAAQQRAEDEERARLETARRQQEDEERRIREAEDERQRKIFDEQKRQAELQALQEAAIQKARLEAEAQARLAELASRQEHERHINALKHDKSKKTLKIAAIASGVFLLLAVIIGGVTIKKVSDQKAEAEKRVQQLQDDKLKAEQEKAAIKAELENTKDPERIAQLQAQLAEKDAKISNLNTDLSNRGSGAAAKPRAGGGGGGAPPPGGGGAPPPKKACNCAPGDPLCSCL
jgi:colicin import membrane protein